MTHPKYGFGTNSFLTNQQTYLYETNILAKVLFYVSLLSGGQEIIILWRIFAHKWLYFSHKTYLHIINFMVIKEHSLTRGILGPGYMWFLLLLLFFKPVLSHSKACLTPRMSDTVQKSPNNLITSLLSIPLLSPPTRFRPLHTRVRVGMLVCVTAHPHTGTRLFDLFAGLSTGMMSPEMRHSADKMTALHLL